MGGGGEGKEEPRKSLVCIFSVNGRLFSAGCILRPEGDLENPLVRPCE